MFSVFSLLSKLLSSKPGKNPASYQQEQTLLLQQLKEASDLHTRQLILDKMMAEDLLHSADLSNTNLHDIHLESANLENADLCGAALPEADLVKANLSQAELSHSQLDGAELANANLDGAHLPYASLRDASLYDARLNRACLDHADLRGCCLMYADLAGASLDGALFDETTVLPDSEQWTPNVDMERYTDVSHPGYVASDTPETPAFQTSILTD